MKRIVILCDGTWNHAASDHPTNVVRLAAALRPVDSDDVPQVPVYVPGVGSGRRGVTAMGRRVDRLLGGALGLGLMANVVEAYTDLVFLYEPGDEIFVFGFSRGAYTARSLVGMIRATGLLSRSSLDLLPRVIARYRSREPDTHPRTPASRDFRLEVSPYVMTHPKDAEIYEAAARAAGRSMPHLLRIAYLGVWDTVGALGIPSRFAIGRLLNRRHAFHDATLSSMVRAARHAVALDERRREYEPTLWANLQTRNAGHDPADPPYRETHFLGDHGGVGGGGPIEATSAIALDWIMDGAAAQGLAFDPGAQARIEAVRDPLGPLTNSPEPKGGLGAAILRALGRDRPGPAEIDQLHPTVKERWAFAHEEWTSYRPGSLAHLETDLAAWRDAQAGDVT
ncbi:DUF2235 domain-containing protein [Jannaschia ovalis]|uniref:DUF2235 domain-containing protein n=1 Tax=Jannaschia ovalis TaxID=3038773 RepID=A0ABY8L9Q4_9RHOB|nr:DUF2235 domain-containing protein [Jannaschia sp. GRR-S6-38]WGH78019.1 DUF2235 domain-containing protein [Jannaschia sp. GRR-S6-38]